MKKKIVKQKCRIKGVTIYPRTSFRLYYLSGCFEPHLKGFPPFRTKLHGTFDGTATFEGVRTRLIGRERFFVKVHVLR